MEAEFLNACEKGQTDVIDSLIDRVDINCIDIYGNTGLILACDVDEPWALDVVTRLLHHGIDVDIRNHYDICALDAILSKVSPKQDLSSLVLMCSKHSINHRDYSSACSQNGMEFLKQNGFTYNNIDITNISDYTAGFCQAYVLFTMSLHSKIPN